MREGCANVTRRGWLLGLSALLAGPEAAAAERPRRRRQRPAPPIRAAPNPPPALPMIDGPPPPSRIPGLEPAPVPSTNARPPLEDRLPQPRLSLGVPTPTLLGEGETFHRGDPSPDTRQPQGFRLPSPGATLRLPF